MRLQPSMLSALREASGQEGQQSYKQQSACCSHCMCLYSWSASRSASGMTSAGISSVELKKKPSLHQRRLIRLGTTGPKKSCVYLWTASACSLEGIRLMVSLFFGVDKLYYNKS